MGFSLSHAVLTILSIDDLNDLAARLETYAQEKLPCPSATYILNCFVVAVSMYVEDPDILRCFAGRVLRKQIESEAPGRRQALPPPMVRYLDVDGLSRARPPPVSSPCPRCPALPCRTCATPMTS